MDLRLTRLALTTAAAGLVAACTSTPTWPPPDTYFVGPRPVTAPRESMHRYMCADRTPLRCTCASLRLGECECHC